MPHKERGSTLFIGKRFYTNRDALHERFGRIYQIPWHWSNAGLRTRLWLIDYHSKRSEQTADGVLEIYSTPVPGRAFFHRTIRELAGKLRRSGVPELVVASGDCYIGLLGFVIARCVKAEFVFDMYDKYDEFSGYSGLLGIDPQSFLLHRADIVSFASTALMRKMQDRTRRSVVVPNGIDRQHFRPMDKRECRRKLDLRIDANIVGYFGSMEPERGVRDLIAAIQLLRSSGLDVELLIGGRAHPDLDLEDPWIRYVGNLDFTNVPVAMACCDVLAIPYRNSPFLDMASSCKIAEYIAVSRPIVATKTPNLVENFPTQADELSDLLASPENIDEIAKSIERQMSEGRLVSLPDKMDWRQISADFANAICNGSINGRAN